MKKIIRLSPTILASFLLLSSLCNIVIRNMGYTFIPYNYIAREIAALIIIIGLTVCGVRYRTEKSGINMWFSVFLPLIALVYVVTKTVVTDAPRIDLNIFFAFPMATIICSVILFFTNVKDERTKIALGSVYGIVLILALFILFFITLFSSISLDTTVKSAVSPSKKYIAEIIDSDHGATGGRTLVMVSTPNINILIGELQKDKKYVYGDRWGKFETMTIRWESDEVLYIDEVRYEIEY